VYIGIYVIESTSLYFKYAKCTPAHSRLGL